MSDWPADIITTRGPKLPMCQYFDAVAPGTVSSDPHDAGEGPLYFFWPLPNGGALRVAVCQEHCDVLAKLCQE